MRLYTRLELFRPERPLVLALGTFDGLHLGHQKILARVVAEARKERAFPAVFTFRNHPQAVLRPANKPPVLMSLEQKLQGFADAGIEICFLIDFTRRFSKLPAETFAGELLARRLGVRKVFLGYNAHFGRDREGDAASMGHYAKRFGFAFQKIGPVRAAGDFVSSSRLRRLIAEGRLAEARACLGRPFSLFGKVARGRGLGGKLGFPTANLEVSSDLLPPVGVYPVTARVMDAPPVPKTGVKRYAVKPGGPWLKGVANYGTRPTVSRGSKKVLEVHFLKKCNDLYGKTLEVAFSARLRPERKFAGPAELRAQIARDVQRARKVLSRPL